MQKTFIMHNEDQLSEMTAYLKEYLIKGTVILLKGDLGSGKTTVVKHFTETMDLKHASSPSFNIIHTYENANIRITHADLYRLTAESSLEELNLYEEIENSDFTFIEWPIKGMETLLDNYKLSVINMYTDGKMHRAEVNI